MRRWETAILNLRVVRECKIACQWFRAVHKNGTLIFLSANILEIIYDLRNYSI